MADLKRYFSQNTRRATVTPLSIAYTGSEKIGQAIQGLGQDLDVIAQREERFWVEKQMSDLDAWTRSAWEESINNSQDGADGFTPNYMASLDAKYDEIRQTAPTGRVRAALDNAMLQHRNQQEAAAHGFQTQEKYEYRKHTILQEADQLSQDIYRNPGVEPWQPQGSLQSAPGLPAPFSKDAGFFSTGVNDPITGLALPDNISAWNSKYYSPRDFADGANMQDRSGAVVIGKRELSALDWVTDQFGYGKLQINSGFRSGASNQKRAESGPHGPHTKGRSIDVQVRHLPQSEKDRLYSLFRAAGANAFGFGEGVLHVEWRDGDRGDGRDGDHEWTYGSASKYNRIPVASPNSRAMLAQEIPASSSGELGNLRPFQSWERRANADGSHSTEVTTTIQDASGRWVNVPSLWRNDDGWVELDEEQQRAAMQAYEAKNGETWQRFETVEEAEAAAQARSDQGGAGAGPNSHNQYPYLAAVAMTSRNETGTTDLATASLQVTREADGTISVGALGLNSSGLLGSFLKENGAALGITAPPSSPEFAQQWEAAVRRDPEGVVGMQLAFHESHVVRPAQSSMQALGAGNVANDPRAIAFTSDLIVQYGEALAKKHIAAGKGAADVESYIAAVTSSTKASIDADFKTALSEDPSMRQGLINRIDRRASGAMSSGPGGAVSTGNVPAWTGPLPQIEDMPEYQARLDRVDAMIDTLGGTPAQRREVRDNIRGQVVRSWISRVADINPSAAMAVLMSGRYDNELSVGDMAAGMNGAQSAYSRMEAEIHQKQKALIDGLKVEASQLFADEIASITATGQGLGRISEAHIAVATEKEKADLAFSQFAYTVTKEIATASADDLPAILEQYRPEGDGFADELRRYQFVQETIAKRMEMQANDPAAMALQQLPDLQSQWQAAMSSNDPVAVSSAIRSIRAAQERMGVPASSIRSMPQNMLANFEEVISKAEDADQAFAGLMQLRGMFGNEAGTVFQEMERAGLGEGWSQVNELVDAGHVLAGKSLARVVHAGEFGDDGKLGVRLAMNGQADAARKIFDGRLRRKEIPGLMPTGKDEDLDMNVKQVIGNYLGDAVGMDGAMFNTVREAALSFYAADLPFGAALDGSKIEAAIDKVTGGILSWNSDGETGKFVAPVAGMTQDQFNAGIWSLDDAAFDGAFVGYASEDQPLTRNDIANLQFVSAGNGVYFLNWPGAGLARNKDGSPFVFDYAAAVQGAIQRKIQGDLVRTIDQRSQDQQILDGIEGNMNIQPMSAW